MGARLKRDQVFAGVKTPALGGVLTSDKYKREWLRLGITADPISMLALSIDALAAQDIKTLGIPLMQRIRQDAV